MQCKGCVSGRGCHAGEMLNAAECSWGIVSRWHGAEGGVGHPGIVLTRHSGQGTRCFVEPPNFIHLPPKRRLQVTKSFEETESWSGENRRIVQAEGLVRLAT